MRISDWSSDVCSSDLHPAENSMTTEISPEAAAAQGEIRHLLEAAIDALPQAQRTVFMLRTVEEFSTEDTAACLGIPPETVKTRLHRAKQHLRRRLQHRVATALTDRSEEHTSELQSLMRISYAVFCLKKKKHRTDNYNKRHYKE